MYCSWVMFVGGGVLGDCSEISDSRVLVFSGEIVIEFLALDFNLNCRVGIILEVVLSPERVGSI